MSNFQDELRNEDGYENVVIIAIGQTNISNFNSNFCANSDLPLVMDQYPQLPIRDVFNSNGYGYHKQVVIIDYDGNIIGSIYLNSGVSNSAKNYIRNIIELNYEQFVLGDINADDTVNVQDIILLINMILNGESEDSADINSDGVIDILDIVQVINIILS